MKMKRKNLFMFIIALFFSFHFVSAMEIDGYKIIASPVTTNLNGNYVENIVELTIINDKETALTQGTLSFAKDADIEGISDSYGNLQYTSEQNTDSQRILFTFTIPIKPEEKRILTIKTRTYNVIQKQGYFEYLLVIVPSKDISSFIHILKLDKEVTLYSTTKSQEDILQQEYIIIPDATITETEKNIIIEWDTVLKKDTPSVFLVRFHQENGINYWKLFGFGFIILFCGVIFGVVGNKLFILYRQKKALKATNILNEREKAVLELIIKNPEIRQSELVKQLGYTKSNVSKIIKRLFLRGLVEVKKDGKMRILNLGEKLKNEL